jgi:DNA-binding XRE family transcriptional regulator
MTMVNPNEEELGLLIGQRLGPKIAALRQGLGMTQAQFAERLHIEPESVSRIERGVSLPSIKRLALIANVLNTGLVELLGETLPVLTVQCRLMESHLQGLTGHDREMLMGLVETLSQRLRLAR